LSQLVIHLQFFIIQHRSIDIINWKDEIVPSQFPFYLKKSAQFLATVFALKEARRNNRN